MSTGTHSLTLILTDLAGNLTSQSYTVTVTPSAIAPAPVMTGVGLLQDTAPGGTFNTDRITSDLSISGMVSATSVPSGKF